MNDEKTKIETRAKHPGKELLSDTVLVAGLTAVAYLTASAYQWAHLSSFKIPALFMSVDLTLVSVTALALLAWVSMIVTVFSLLVGWRAAGWVKVFLAIIAGIFLMGLPIIFLLLDPAHPWLSVAGILAALVITVFQVRGMYRHARNGTEPSDGLTQLLNISEGYFGVSRTLIIGASFLFILCGAGLGGVVGKYRTSFLVPSTDRNVAIITIYKDQFVGLVFDPGTKTLGGQIRLLNQNALATDVTFEVVQNISKQSGQ
jgi:hypothetical protein